MQRRYYVLSICFALLMLGLRSTYATPERPLLLVPGLMGTILQTHYFESGEISQLFPLELLEQTLRMSEMYCQCTLYPDLDNGDEDDDHHCYSIRPEEFEVVVPMDNFGLYAIDYLAPYADDEDDKRPYFHSMIEFLVEQLGYEPGVNLFGYPYDWRQPIAEIGQGLESRVYGILEETGASQLDIVSHSLGCLVTQNYLSREVDPAYTQRANVDPWISSPTGEIRRRHPLVYRHIAAGGPYAGIGAEWTIMMNMGFMFPTVSLTYWNSHQLLVQFPSTYEFISRSVLYVDLRLEQGIIEDARSEPIPTLGYIKNGDNVTQAAGSESVTIVESVLSGNTLNFNDGHDGSCPLPFRRDLYEDSMNSILGLEGNIQQPTYFFPIYGLTGDSSWSVFFPVDVGDSDDYHLLLGKPVGLLQISPPYTPSISHCTPGDGIVPYISTTKSGMDPSYTTYFISNGHLDLVKDHFEDYQHLLGLSCSWTGYWTVQIPNITISGSTGELIAYCSHTFPREHQWVCSGELCARYNSTLNTAVVILKLQQIHWDVFSLQDDVGGAEVSSIQSLSGRVWDNTLSGSFTLSSGEILSFQFTMNTTNDCNSFSGFYSHDWGERVDMNAVRESKQSIPSASELSCQFGATRSCASEHFTDSEQCDEQGFWSTCSSCEEGYTLHSGFPYKKDTCVLNTQLPPSPSPLPSQSASSSILSSFSLASPSSSNITNTTSPIPSPSEMGPSTLWLFIILISGIVGLAVVSVLLVSLVKWRSHMSTTLDIVGEDEKEMVEVEMDTIEGE